MRRYAGTGSQQRHDAMEFAFQFARIAGPFVLFQRGDSRRQQLNIFLLFGLRRIK